MHIYGKYLFRGNKHAAIIQPLPISWASLAQAGGGREGAGIMNREKEILGERRASERTQEEPPPPNQRSWAGRLERRNLKGQKGAGRSRESRAGAAGRGRRVRAERSRRRGTMAGGPRAPHLMVPAAPRLPRRGRRRAEGLFSGGEADAAGTREQRRLRLRRPGYTISARRGEAPARRARATRG